MGVHFLIFLNDLYSFSSNNFTEYILVNMHGSQLTVKDDNLTGLTRIFTFLFFLLLFTLKHISNQ